MGCGRYEQISKTPGPRPGSPVLIYDRTGIHIPVREMNQGFQPWNREREKAGLGNPLPLPVRGNETPDDL